MGFVTQGRSIDLDSRVSCRLVVPTANTLRGAVLMFNVAHNNEHYGNIVVLHAAEGTCSAFNSKDPAPKVAGHSKSSPLQGSTWQELAGWRDGLVLVCPPRRCSELSHDLRDGCRIAGRPALSKPASSADFIGCARLKALAVCCTCDDQQSPGEHYLW